MIEEARKVVADALAGGEVEGVLILRKADGAVGPHMFVPGDDLADLVLSPKYPLPTVIRWLQFHSKETRIGAVLRGCEERALIELAKRRQVDMDRLVVIGLACTAEEARECGCTAGRPASVKIGTAAGDLPEHRELKDLPSSEKGLRLDYWKEQYSKCIKCYGCRDVCPVCACVECMMAEHDWVEGGTIPPAFATFHLIKAYHMADRCVECRECEGACPVSIPLAEMYGRLLRDMERRFGYVPGANLDEKPPLLTTLMDEPILDEEGG